MPEKKEKYIHPAVIQYVVYRKAKGMKAQDVADLTGISIDSIRSYESGRMVPSLMFMTKMAIAVGCTGVGCEGYKG